MHKINIVTVTPNLESMIVHMARVSNHKSQKEGGNEKRLIQYLIKHKHWSPFEMANIVLEIETTRDIARQILRHRSFSFQEFSQRYAEATEYQYRETRLQHPTNRQSSLETDKEDLKEVWETLQHKVMDIAKGSYEAALKLGIAKEVARAVLPEGLTMSKMYVNGNVRSWIHYLQVRCGEETQLEHRLLALDIYDKLNKLYPNIFCWR